MVKEKVEYTNKKEAWEKLRFIQQNVNRKIIPRRIYFDRVRGRWRMTSKELTTPPSFKEIFEMCYKFAYEAGSAEDKLLAKKVLRYVSFITKKKIKNKGAGIEDN